MSGPGIGACTHPPAGIPIPRMGACTHPNSSRLSGGEPAPATIWGRPRAPSRVHQVHAGDMLDLAQARHDLDGDLDPRLLGGIALEPLHARERGVIDLDAGDPLVHVGAASACCAEASRRRASARARNPAATTPRASAKRGTS